MGILTPVEELDIATGKLLFEWASLDHVSPDGMSDYPKMIPSAF